MIRRATSDCVANSSLVEAEMMERGFCVFNDVLSDAEITDLQSTIRWFFKLGGRKVDGGGKKIGNAVIEVPAINWLFHHPKILSCFRSALGSQAIMFTGSAGIQKDVFTSWHKDDGTDASRPDYPGYFSNFTYEVNECKVYRLGVYLQDHDCDEYGLSVREGSHRFKSLEDGPAYYTGARARSIIIFDARITHAGQLKSKVLGRLLDWSSSLKPAKETVERVRALYRAAMGRERIAIFSSFGLPNTYTIEYARRIMEKELRLTGGVMSNLPLAFRRALNQNGVSLAQDHFSELRQAA